MTAIKNLTRTRGKIAIAAGTVTSADRPAPEPYHSHPSRLLLIMVPAAMMGSVVISSSHLQPPPTTMEESAIILRAEIEPSIRDPTLKCRLPSQLGSAVKWATWERSAPCWDIW